MRHSSRSRRRVGFGAFRGLAGMGEGEWEEEIVDWKRELVKCDGTTK
jgi:hypothetical protein